MATRTTPKPAYAVTPRQLPSGRWKGRVVHYDVDSQRHEETRTFDTKREAKGWAEEEAARQRADPGDGGAGGAEPLGDYLPRWLALKRTLNLARKTLASYREMTVHSVDGLGQVALADLTPYQIQQLYTDLSETRRLSPPTIRYVHTVLKMALSDAVEWGIIPSNPAARVKVAMATVRAPALRIPPPAEMAQLLEANRETRWYPLWAWLSSTGSRLGEALALRWDDIDVSQGTATIQQAVSGDAGSRVIKTPKTASGSRTIALGPRLLQVLAEHRATQAVFRDVAGSAWQDTGLVVTTQEGRLLSKRNVHRAFKSARARAGLPKSIRVHDLRHGMATHWLAQGKNPRVVSQRLGHANVAFTLQIYGHVLPSDEARIAEDMEGDLLPDAAGQSVDGPQTGRRNSPKATKSAGRPS